MADNPTHLSPSELGTKEYWETYYARTLSHLSTKHESTTKPSTHDSNSDSEDEEVDDDSDPGTSWFSEHNAPDKVLRFLTSDDFPLSPANTSQNGTEPSILDLGTGNGSMLALLRKRGGFRGVMVGVDYSGRSVELARELQRLKIHSAYLSDSEDEDEPTENTAGEKEGEGDTNIRFEEYDVLSTSHQKPDWLPESGFDIVLDKGTFDAISLSDETTTTTSEDDTKGDKVIQRRICEQYPGIARNLVRKGGFLVVTSCNWTEEELVRWFTRDGEDGDGLRVWGRVEYPRFRFGGMEGQGVCTVCFQR